MDKSKLMDEKLANYSVLKNQNKFTEK